MLFKQTTAIVNRDLTDKHLRHMRRTEFFAPEITKLFNTVAEKAQIPFASLLKMLRKLFSVCSVDNFRPISLTKNDLQNLLHVPASRLKPFYILKETSICLPAKPQHKYGYLTR